MIKSVCQAAAEVMRLVCGNSAHTTCVTHNGSQEGWVGHRSRKLAVRRNVGSLLKLQPPRGLTERKYTGKWGVLIAAEKRAHGRWQCHCFKDTIEDSAG